MVNPAFDSIIYYKFNLFDSSTGYEKEVKFDYQLLDDLISWLRVFRMRPGFELMGNPGSLFDDLDSNPETLLLWKSFVADLASHYISK